MNPHNLSIDEICCIGENYLWTFHVGRLGATSGQVRWIAAAIARTSVPGARMLEIFPDVAEGYQLGLADRAAAVRLASAILADPESDYGPVAVWWIADEERGDPEDYRCPACGRVGCDGMECDDEC